MPSAVRLISNFLVSSQPLFYVGDRDQLYGPDRTLCVSPLLQQLPAICQASSCSRCQVWFDPALHLETDGSVVRMTSTISEL